MDLGLTGRIALVVGGTGRIGRAVAERFELEGARVLTVARSTGFDVSDDASVESAIASVIAEHSRIDALVVTAAPSARTLDPTKSSDPAHVLAAVDGKALGFLRVANAVIPHMVEAGYGRVIGVSGQNALVTGSIAAGLRNAALIIAAKNLADAAAGSGVTVNVVNPGIVVEGAPAAPQRGAPGEATFAQVADLVAFLSSPLAGGVSGESIAVGHRIPGTISL